MARFVSFLVLVAILVVLAIVFFQVMAGFFVPLFLAALLGVVVQPLYRWTLSKVPRYRYVAAGITTTLVALIVLLPIGMVVTTATLEGLSLIDQLQLGNVRAKLDQLRHDFGLQIPREGDVRRIEASLKHWRGQQRTGVSPTFSAEAVQNLLDRLDALDIWLQEQVDEGLGSGIDTQPLRQRLERLRDSPPDSVERDIALADADAEFREFKRNLLGGTYRAWFTEAANPSEDQIEQLRRSVVVAAGPVLSFGSDTALLLAKIGFGTLIMVATLFFLLAEGPRMLTGLIKILPLEEHNVRELTSEFDRACRAIVSATLLSAIAQGLLAGVGFYFCGLRQSVALLMLLTMVLALVPFTGAAAVWIPVSLYLYFYQGSTVYAVGLAIYGTLVISASDNVIKPLVLHGQSNLHPLLALLSVLGGIQALGPIGILVGPMVVVFLQVLLKLVQREVSSLDKSSWMFWRSMGGLSPAASQAAASAAMAASVSPPADIGTTSVSSSPSQPGNGHGATPSKRQAEPHGKKRKK
jgi:predicted PurR-regulated permease PerM